MVLKNDQFSKNYCGKCFEKYINIQYKWCNRPCQINYLKKNFINWTSGNEKIDNLIQEKRLEINKSYDTVFEWIPYYQFDDIKEKGKGGFATVYSAIWKDGPLCYNEKNLMRKSGEKIAIKCLYNL